MHKKEIQEQHTEIIDRVLEESESWKSIRKIRDELSQELNVELTFHNIRDIINRQITKTREKLQEMSEDFSEELDTEEDENWNVLINLYHKLTDSTTWEIVTKKYQINMEVFVDIVRDFSKYWANKTGEQIKQKYDLSQWAWWFLKNRLHIYKDTHVLPPIVADYINQTYGEDALQERIEKEHIQWLQDQYIEKHKETAENVKKKELKRLWKIHANITNFLEYMEDFLENYQPREFQKVERCEESYKKEETTYVFWDIHIGWPWTNKAEERLRKMTQNIIEDNPKKAHIICLWDLAETLKEWGMHPWQIEEMDWPFNWDLVTYIAEIFENMLYDLYSEWIEVEFDWIWWNHDRLGKSREEDQRRTWAFFIYKMIEKALKYTDIEINYTTSAIKSIDKWNKNFIISHWELNSQAKQRVMLEYSKAWAYNILLMWHLHHYNATEINEKLMEVYAPALAEPNKYAEDNCYSSQNWYLQLQENNEELLDVALKRLK